MIRNHATVPFITYITVEPLREVSGLFASLCKGPDHQLALALVCSFALKTSVNRHGKPQKAIPFFAEISSLLSDSEWCTVKSPFLPFVGGGIYMSGNSSLDTSESVFLNFLCYYLASCHT